APSRAPRASPDSWTRCSSTAWCRTPERSARPDWRGLLAVEPLREVHDLARLAPRDVRQHRRHRPRELRFVGPLVELVADRVGRLDLGLAAAARGDLRVAE